MLYSCFRITKTICKPNQFYNQKLSSNFRKRHTFIVFKINIIDISLDCFQTIASRYKIIESATETMTARTETMAAKYKTIESPP